MHEYSICRNLVETILKEMTQHQPVPRRLLKAHVVIGQLRQIIPDQLRFAYTALIQDTPAQGSELVVHSHPLRIRCHKCGWQGEISCRAFFCKACGTSDLEMTGGRELYLDNLEIELDDAKAN